MEALKKIGIGFGKFIAQSAIIYFAAVGVCAIGKIGAKEEKKIEPLEDLPY